MDSTTVTVLPVPGGPNRMYGIGRQAALTMASTAHLCRGFSLVLMYWRGAGASGGGGGGGLVVGNKTVDFKKTAGC